MRLVTGLVLDGSRAVKEDQRCPGEIGWDYAITPIYDGKVIQS